MAQRSSVATRLLEVTSQSDAVTLHNSVEDRQTDGQRNKLQAQPYGVTPWWHTVPKNTSGTTECGAWHCAPIPIGNTTHHECHVTSAPRCIRLYRSRCYCRCGNVQLWSQCPRVVKCGQQFEQLPQPVSATCSRDNSGNATFSTACTTWTHIEHSREMSAAPWAYRVRRSVQHAMRKQILREAYLCVTNRDLDAAIRNCGHTPSYCWCKSVVV
jgi:hypothetical protein